MKNVSVARRYAKALIEVAGAHSDQVLEQLTSLVELFDQSPELNDLATNPAYTRSQRSEVMEALITQGKLDGAVANLLRLLVDRNRLATLPDIARLYREQADQKAGRVRGKVTSAVPLQPDALQRLQSSLERLVERNVVLESKVDPRLLGGVAAQVGSVVYDGTLRTQLDELRRSLQSR